MDRNIYAAELTLELRSGILQSAELFERILAGFPGAIGELPKTSKLNFI